MRVVTLAAFLLSFLVAAAVVGQAPEPVLSGQDRIEVVSPAGVATFEGELRARGRLLCPYLPGSI